MGMTKQRTIRELREERKWSVANLAAKIGVSTEQVSHWETGTPPIDVIRRIADTFDIQPEDIALPAHTRLLNVHGHRFLLTTHRDSATTWQAQVTGWDPTGATRRIDRPIESENSDRDSPMTFLNETWRETRPTADDALTALGERVAVEIARM